MIVKEEGCLICERSSYDALGRATRSVHDLAGLTPDVTFDQTFDAVGNRTQLAATIGTTADYVTNWTYDALGKTTQILQEAQPGGNAVEYKRIDYTYQNPSQGEEFYKVERFASPGTDDRVVYTGRTYDTAGRLELHSLISGGLQHGQYLGYDGHLLTGVAVIALPGFQVIERALYTYDEVDQVTNVDYTGLGMPPDETHSYDGVGNRTDTGYVTGDHNRLLSDGTYAYSYDADGNRTARFVDSDSDGVLSTGDTSITEYVWDHRHRLIEVTSRDSYGSAATQAVKYGYDAFNRLVDKVFDSDGDGAADDEYFWIHDGNEAVLEFDGDSAADLSHRYLWGAAVDELLADGGINAAGSEPQLRNR